MNKGVELLVSIVMAVYNGESYLKWQLDSILNQSFRDFELIICDDNSIDGSWDILNEYAKSDKRIKLYRNSKTLGLVKNFENLLKRARGEYIALSDQDDIWHKDKLKEQLKSISGAKWVLIHSDLELIDENNTPIAPSYFKKKGYLFPPSSNLALMLSRCGVMGNTILIDRELLKRLLPFPKNLKYHDWYIAVVAEAFGKRVTLNRALVKYRIHTKNTSKKALWLNGAMRYPWRHRWLPFRDRWKKEALEYLLDRVDSDFNKRVIEVYLEYLKRKKGWIYLYPKMRRLGFFDGSLRYRVRIVLRLIVASLIGENVK